jgi:hypothetical protein
MDNLKAEPNATSSLHLTSTLYAGKTKDELVPLIWHFPYSNKFADKENLMTALKAALMDDSDDWDFVNEQHLAMMVNVIIIDYMSPRPSALIIIRHQGSKRPDCVLRPVNRGRHAGGSSAGVWGQAIVLRPLPSIPTTRLFGIQSINVNTYVNQWHVLASLVVLFSPENDSEYREL